MRGSVNTDTIKLFKELQKKAKGSIRWKNITINLLIKHRCNINLINFNKQ